jgi:hypothetical protein
VTIRPRPATTRTANREAANIGLIDLVTRYALDHEYTTVLEGILYVAHYGEMLIRLRDDHLGRSLFYYIDIPFEETLRRHAGKPKAAEYGRAEMSQWYRDKDLLPGGIEDIIPADSSLEDTVQQIMVKAELARTPAASA